MSDFKIGNEVFYDDFKDKYTITEIQKNENVMDIVFYRGYNSNGDFITRTEDSIKRKESWIPDNNSTYEMRFICSSCKRSEVVPTIGFTKCKPLWNFCPFCGADMRE